MKNVPDPRSVRFIVHFDSWQVDCMSPILNKSYRIIYVEDHPLYGLAQTVDFPADKNEGVITFKADLNRASGKATRLMFETILAAAYQRFRDDIHEMPDQPSLLD